MIDRIVVLDDKTNIYILDEIEYKGKRFVYGVECEFSSSDIKENYYVLEVDMKDNKLLLKDIEDIETISVVNNIFLSRIKNQ